MSARVRPAGHPVVALTIAGSDPSGGAGVQADLKTFAALDAYGCAVLTGLTAQSTVGVSRVFAVPADVVTDQLATLTADVALDAVKIGMTTDATVAVAIADALRRLRRGPRPPVVVLDPVMVATSGDRLLAAEAEAVVREELVPLADLITPNLAEAAVLLGTTPARSPQEAAEHAVALRALGTPWCLVKGGHLDGGEAIDHLAGPDGVHPVTAPRVTTRNTHGTGCTLSSAIAVERARRPDWPSAVQAAKRYLTAALAAADELVIGGTGTAPGPYGGHGPVHHGAA